MKSTILGVSSTALSGFTNLIIQLAVATYLSAEAFGEFSLLSATIILLLGAGRATIGQTDLLRGTPSHHSGPATTAYISAAVLVLSGGLIYSLAMLLQLPLMLPLGVGVGASSVFILQDAARFRAFRVGRPGVALFSDVILTAGVVTTLVWIPLTSAPERSAVVGWTISTLIAFLPAAVVLRFIPSRSTIAWIRRERDIVSPAFGEYVLQSLLPYAVNWVIVAVAGLGALGGYRIAQLLFAALINFATGLNATTIPRIVDRGDREFAKRKLSHNVRLLTALGALLAGTLYLVPPRFGEQVFGTTWLLALPFVIPAALHGLVNSLGVMNFAILRLVGHARFSFKVRVWSSVLALPAVSLGVWLGGALGAAYALAITASIAYSARAVRARKALAQW